MPYDRLPARLRQLIPSERGQEIFRNTVNSQLENGRSESVAFASAWAQLRRAGFERDNATGKWERVEKSRKDTLEEKVREHNAEHGDKGRVTLSMLEQVYDRGVGAYRTNPSSVRPNVKSPEQWAMARVNVFLRAIRTGKFPSGKFDTDLLPKEHALSTRKSQPTASAVHVPSTDWEKAETYRPPASARAAARRAIRWKEKYGDKVRGGTQVGWTRAGQLARGENLSRETVARMASFFARHRGNEKVDPKFKDEPWRDNGYIMHLAWGGDAAASWSRRIMDRLKKSVDLGPLTFKSGVSSNRVEHPRDVLSSANDDLGPCLAVFSLKSDVASVSKKAELLGTPFFCTDAGSDAESLLIVPLSKVSVPVEPSSDVVWNQIGVDIGRNEVVCLSRNDTPSGQIFNKIGTGYSNCPIGNFIVDVRTSDINISREPNIFSKFIHMLNVGGGEGEPKIVFELPDAPISKNEASPISSNWAVPLEKIFIPFSGICRGDSNSPRAVLSKNSLIFDVFTDSTDSAPQSSGDFSGAHTFSVEINDFAFLNFGKGVLGPATSFPDDAGIMKDGGGCRTSDAELSGRLKKGVSSNVELDNFFAGLFRNVSGHVDCDTLGGSQSQLQKRQIDDDSFTDPASAVVRSMDLGLEGEIHVHDRDGQAVYMPGESHEDYLERIREIAGISDDSDDPKEGLLERAISAIIGAIMQQVPISKSQEQATVLKIDDEQGLVYGWAYVSTEDGNLLVDSQGDSIEPIEMEKMATNFMLNSRNAKVMHKGENVGTFVHSLPLTNDIMKAFDIYSDREGWIVAMKPDTPEVMKAYKSGEYTGFSIGGKAGDVEDYDAA